jgi:uncharacterized protein YhbP (UPF0306 family)
MEGRLKSDSNSLITTLQPVQEIIATSVMTLATCGPSGEPHAAAVYFACDDRLNFYFFSNPESQHVQDLVRDSHAAVSIHPECSDWQDIRGLQIRGKVEKLERGSDWDRAWELYVAKFPFVAGLGPVVASNEFYRFTPLWVRLVDNRQGFGHKREWRIRGEIFSEVS